MNLTEQEYNRLSAEFMDADYACSDVQSWHYNFNPYSDANDRDKLVEKMLNEKLVEEVCLSVNEGEHMCTFLFTKYSGIGYIEKSLALAINKCISRVLMDWRDSK